MTARSLFFDTFKQGDSRGTLSHAHDAATGAVYVKVPDTIDDPAAVRSFILNYTIAYVKRHGPLKELTIAGHGTEGSVIGKMVKLGDPADFVLEMQQRSLKEGLPKLTERVVFNGCNTFNFDLDHGQMDHRWEKLIKDRIEMLRSLAKVSNTELVGSTTITGSTILGTVFETGRWVQFTADGEIRRDKLDKSGLLSLANAAAHGHIDKLSWEECYIGQSPSSAATCYTQQNIKKRSDEHYK